MSDAPEAMVYQMRDALNHDDAELASRLLHDVGGPCDRIDFAKQVASQTYARIGIHKHIGGTETLTMGNHNWGTVAAVDQLECIRKEETTKK